MIRSEATLMTKQTSEKQLEKYALEWCATSIFVHTL